MKKFKFVAVILFSVLLFTGITTKVNAYQSNFSILACSQKDGSQKYESYQRNKVINSSTVRFYTEDYKGYSIQNVYLDDEHIGRVDRKNNRIYFADYKEKGNWVYKTFDVKNISAGEHRLKIIATTPFGDKYIDVIEFKVEY